MTPRVTVLLAADKSHSIMMIMTEDGRHIEVKLSPEATVKAQKDLRRCAWKMGKYE